MPSSWLPVWKSSMYRFFSWCILIPFPCTASVGLPLPFGAGCLEVRWYPCYFKHRPCDCSSLHSKVEWARGEFSYNTTMLWSVPIFCNLMLSVHINRENSTELVVMLELQLTIDLQQFLGKVCSLKGLNFKLSWVVSAGCMYERQSDQSACLYWIIQS